MSLPIVPSLNSASPPHVRAALLEAARRAPAAIEEDTGLVYILGYEECRRVLNDRALPGAQLTLFDLVGVTDGPLRDWYSGIMFARDGDEHHRLRRLVSKAFTPHSVDRLRPIAASLIRDRLQGLESEGKGDLVALLHEVPMHVMCALLGVPEVDVPKFLAWVDDLTPVFGVMTPEQVAAATAAVESLLLYTAALCERRDEEPEADLISALIAAEEDGDRLTRSETTAMVANLLVAGHDTTASQICCSCLTLLRRPEVMETLRLRPELLASITEETIRIEPSIGASGRVPVEEYSAAGQSWPPGTFLMCASITANRDPQVWESPESFVPDRFLHRAAPKMLSFGAGAHFCLGAWLARMTLEEVVRAVSDIAPRPAGDLNDIAWVAPLGAYPASLPVTL